MKILFNDGQTLQVQSISAANGTMFINIINNAYEQLKHLFTDPISTKKISIENENGEVGDVYENYTVFESIRENSGGIFIVEMQQHGKDTATRIAELEEENAMLTACVLELSELVYQ